MRRRIGRSIGRIVRIGEHERRPTFRLLVHADLIRPHSAEVIDPQRIAFARRNCLKAHYDFFLFTGRDWKDSRPQQPVAHPLQQGRITLATNNLLVDLSRPICSHCLARDQLTVDRELEILECRTFRQRKHEVGFTDPASTIDVGLSYFIAQHAIDEIDTHVTALSKYVWCGNAARRHWADSSLAAWRWNRTWPRMRWPFENLC